MCVSIALWARSPSALFIAARVICVFITSQQWDWLLLIWQKRARSVSPPPLLASIHSVRRMIIQASIVIALYLYYWWQVSVLLPGATSAGCGCGDSGCGLCLELGVLSIPVVASGPAVLHQATLPTLASSSSANLTSSILYRGWWPLHPGAVVRGSGPPSSLYNIHFDLSCDSHVPWLTVMLTFCNTVTVCMQTPTVRWQNSVVTSHHHQGSAGKQAGTEDLPAFNILFSSFHLNRKVYFHSIRWMCQSSSSA